MYCREKLGKHDTGGGAEGERLDNVPDGADAAVGEDRHSAVGPAARVVGDAEHGSGLRAADGEHLLRDADGARAHPDAQAVRTRVQQILRLLRRHHCAQGSPQSDAYA